ncbi:hypothetical protein [uncultured Aquimarina sp.]|uniref:hypothetical protein n=1 Tax=uncultured Aquimarina sp. TaxID=575652 RepID=UPI0026362617|nr:hypothetical protein [uncultured Aquimarina sp.]
MKNRFLLLLLLIVVNVCAQDPKLSEEFTVEVGEEYGETDGRLKEFYKYNDYVIKLVNHKSYDLIIQKFDPVTLKEIERIEKVDFFKDVKKGRLLGVERLSDKLILLYRLWDKKAKTTSFRIRTIALGSLEITDFKTIVIQKGEVSRNSSYYKTSFDENKLLIVCKLKPQKNKSSKNIDIFSIHVFDENVNEIWSNNVKMPYTKTTSMNLRFSIDNEGSFYFLTRVYKDEKSKKKALFLNPESTIELLKLKKDTDEFTISKIKMDGYFVYVPAIFQNPEGGVVVTGTLGKSFDVKKKESVLVPIGFFISKFTEEDTAGETNTYDFSDSILNKYKEDKRISKKAISKLGPYFKDMQITDMVFNEDGSTILLGEQKSQFSNNMSNPNIGIDIRYSSSFNDIYVAKILADGTLSWSKRLPKQQRVDNRGASEMSFKYVDLNTKHYLFYQDHIANLNLDKEVSPGPLWDLTTGYLMAYTIDDVTGSVKKEAVFNLVDVNNGDKLEHFVTDNVLKISDSEILIEGFEGSSKDFLVKVTAKN